VDRRDAALAGHRLEELRGAALDLLARGTYPFADMPRQIVGLDGAAELLETMAGERGVPPVHAVLVPPGSTG